MKAELWNHISKIVQEQPQQIEKLRESHENRANEIIDIQFAMSDYQYMNDVVSIKKLSNDIIKLDMKIDECKDGIHDARKKTYYKEKD